MNTFNIYNKALEIHCKHSRRLYNYGQSWCAENHDMLHCDETCPFRDEENDRFIYFYYFLPTQYL